MTDSHIMATLIALQGAFDTSMKADVLIPLPDSRCSLHFSPLRLVRLRRRGSVSEVCLLNGIKRHTLVFWFLFLFECGLIRSVMLNVFACIHTVFRLHELIL